LRPTASKASAQTDRARPQFWRHDYLHLRPLARDLEARIGAAVSERKLRRVLDLASGSSPYRPFFGNGIEEFVRFDADATFCPGVRGRAEALPFGDMSFDAVLSTQALGLVDDPFAVGREIVRVTRPGGLVWLTGPAAWPYDSARPEHRFGEPDLPRLLPGLEIREIVTQGGMLALPFALLNIAVREAGRSASRRLGLGDEAFEGSASVIYLLSNLCGRGLEMLAEQGPLSTFLTYLDRRLPMNYLVVAEKPQ
jgi:SAM-dependent methyltransferase